MKHDAIFELHLSPVGGRKKPVAAQFTLPIVLGEQTLHECKFDLKDRKMLAPGETGIAYVRFLRPESLQGKLQIGCTFGLWDRHLIGYGKVLELSKDSVK